MFGDFSNDALLALATLIATKGEKSNHPPTRILSYKPLYSAGRNDKCPCKSGRKFKTCCINTKVVIELQSQTPAMANQS